MLPFTYVISLVIYLHAGMRVRMGIATGNLLFGASPAGSAVMDLAKSEHRQE